MNLKHILPKHLSSFFTILLFFAFFVLYASMAAPGLDWGDAGETQLAAWTAGLSHPTGYPLFLMLGWLWSHLLALFGVPPTRAMTLFSVTAGAATVAMMVPMMEALFRRMRLGPHPNPSPNNRREANGNLGPLPNPSGNSSASELALSANWIACIALSAAAFFGFSNTFWSQALLAEVYTFHLLCLVLLLWGLWAKALDAKRLYGLALLYGISLSHHRTMIFWAPGLLIWLWFEQRDLFQPRRFLLLCACVLLPELLYLYVAWRGVVTPYLHQALTDSQPFTLYDGSWQALLDHLSGVTFASELGLKQPLSERLGGVWRLGQANLASSWLVVGMGIVLSFAGVKSKENDSAKKVVLPVADRWLLATGGIGTLLFGIIYAIADVEVMFIPVWLVSTILMFAGIAILLASHQQQPRFSWFPYLILFLLLSLVGTQLYPMPDSRATHTAPRELVNSILAANPPENAILITNDRNEMVPVWYAQFAEGQRADMLGLFPLITPAPEHQHVSQLVNWALQWERPVLLIKPMPGLSLQYELEPYTEPLVRVIGPAILPTEPVLQADLAPQLSVVGWSASHDPVRAGDIVTLSFALQPNTPIEQNLSFSLQLFNADGTPVTQQDISPDPFLPSSEWPTNAPLRLRIPLTIPADTPPGAHEWRLSSYLLTEEGFSSVGQQIIIAQFELR